jgi:hypothetical protein
MRSVVLKTLKTGVNIMSLVAQSHRFVPHSLATGSPAIGQPALGQVHNLEAVGLTVRAVAPFGRNSAEFGFTGLLIEIISASLDRRTRSIPELAELGMTTFGLSQSRAIVLRKQVIDRLDARAWIKGGAPRRNRIGLPKASKASRRQISQRKV